MQQDPHFGGFLKQFKSRLLPLVDSLNTVFPPKEADQSSRPVAGVQRSDSETMNGMHTRQPPPPPPHAPLPEDFQDMRRQRGLRGMPQDQIQAEQMAKAREKEMEEELEHSLKQLDSERKEGLYRLDWELAEAIEALHARHAERANKMIHQHREVKATMQQRAKAGEQMTPEKVQRLRTPVQAPIQPLQHHQFEDHADMEPEESEAEEEAEEESEEESEEEGVFSRFLNRGMATMRSVAETHLEPLVRRAPWVQNGSEAYPQHFDPYQQQQFAPPHVMAGPPRRPGGFMPEGALCPLDRPNGYTPSSPTGMVTSSLGFEAREAAPNLPFSNGFDMPPFPNGHQSAQSGFNGGFEPTLASLTSDWSPAAVGMSSDLSPVGNLFKTSFSQPPPAQQQSSMQWPPANVYH